MIRALNTLAFALAAASTVASLPAVAVTANDAPIVIAREATEGPRGGDNERPGDRQRRGGRGLQDSNGYDQIAREATEGPRGGDNERPGDRQRRGGRG